MTTGFVRFVPGAEDLVRAVLLPGAACVRVSDDAAGAGVGVAGDYAGVALAVWVSAAQGACVLVNRGLALAWHPDLLGDGQPALVAAVADGLGDFVVARFAVDLRPGGGGGLGRAVRRVEAEYLLGTIRLWVDGAEVTAGATGGSAETIGADAGVLSLGGAVGGSVVRSAALAGYTAAAGAASKWTANTGGDVVDAVSGGIGWFMVERSAGVPIVWARFGDALYDEVDAGLSASPNDPTHGFAWVGSGSPQFGGMMATVESTELGLCADGRDGWYKVVFTDASDTTIMANGPGLTLTGTVSGAKTATPIGIPRVEIRNSKAVVSGFFRLDDGEYFPWAGVTNETITAAADAGGLFGSETTSTESAALTTTAVANRSRVGSDGEPVNNLRRTRFKSGSVPSGFAVSPVLTIDADAQDHTDGATVSIVDQVSGLSNKFTNRATSTNAFTYRKDRYGAGRHAFQLVAGESIDNAAAVTSSSGYTVHIVLESAPDSGSLGTSRYMEICHATNGTGIDFRGAEQVTTRLATGAATSTRARDAIKYQPVNKAIVLHTFVFEANGDVRHWVNGRSYVGAGFAALAASFTGRRLISRLAGTGSAYVRRYDVIEGSLTDAQVLADHDYYANVIYADDEDLQGSLVCFVNSSGTTSGSGRYNDPISEINATIFPSSGTGKWSNNLSGTAKDWGIILACGDTVDTVAGNVARTNEDPAFPWFIGRDTAPSGGSPIPILDYVDQASGTGRIIFQINNSGENDEICLCGVEVTSSTRNYRSGGSATVADSEDEEVTLFACVSGHKGLQIVGCPISQVTHAVVDSSGSLSGQNYSHANLEVWRSPVRNTYTNDSTNGSGGTDEATAFFTSNREQIWFRDNAGYECGWDPDVVLSSASINLWGGSSFNGAATDRPALDNAYGRFLYASTDNGSSGAVLIDGLLNTRDSSHDLQLRTGGQVRNFARWESAGPMFSRKHDSYHYRLYAEGSRSITGGNAIGYRGSQFRSGDTDGDANETSPRLAVWDTVIVNNGVDADGFEGLVVLAGRTNITAGEPSGAAVVRASNITVLGSNRAVSFRDTTTELQGYLRDCILDLSGRTSSDHVIEWDHTGTHSSFAIDGIGYDRNNVAESAAFEYNGTDNTIAQLRTNTGLPITPVLDRTADGWNLSTRSLATWCTSVHGFTKVDSGQTDAEELGEQLWEAFADAIRTGGDHTPYNAESFWAWLIQGWQYDSASDAAIEAVDSGAYWGAVEFVAAPPAARGTGSARGRGAIRTRKGVAMHAGRGR